jgi:hypothetical protein
MQHDTDSSLFLVWKVDTPQESHAQNLIWAYNIYILPINLLNNQLHGTVFFSCVAYTTLLPTHVQFLRFSN